MFRKLLQTLSLVTVIAVLASCSKNPPEDQKVSGKPVVFVEETTTATTTEETMAAATEYEIVESVASGEADYSYDYTDDEVIATEPSEVEEDDEFVVEDEETGDYLKVLPALDYSEEFDINDVSYRDELFDESLIELADMWHEEGYLIIGAETLAKNGASFSIDNQHYFYRGFMAASHNVEVPRVMYYFILPEDMLFELIGRYVDFAQDYTEDGDIITFDFGDIDGISLTYDRSTMIMEYSMWAVE